MPYLYCKQHGRAREKEIIEQEKVYSQAGEIVMVVKGKLNTGPWVCEVCNATLNTGDPAFLVTGFLSPLPDLKNYAFAYERDYFAMNKIDTATAYGANWPDDSLHNRRPVPTGKKVALKKL